MMREDIGTHKLGRGMIITAWILLIVLLTLLFQSILDRQINPNRQPEGRIGLQGAREVELHRNKAGHYVASGYINGQPVTFLLDTGATDVALPASLADQLQLKRGPVSISQTANGQVKVWRTRLDEVKIGLISMQDVRATILPSMSGDVLLGMSFLKRLELIQKGKVLTLRQY